MGTDMAANMNVVPDKCEIARGHVRTAINSAWRFPRNIFVGDWWEFFFFDSDWMREPGFVEHLHGLLDLDGSQCACLWKLDSDGPNEPCFFFVRDQTTTEDYRVILAGTTPGYDWLDAMERVACASDSGAWCMHCEPNNEIAVIGFRHIDGFRLYSSVMAHIHATRFEEAIRDPPLSYWFSERALSPEWRDEFLREYAKRSR